MTGIRDNTRPWQFALYNCAALFLAVGIEGLL
jgi:hypothetical protein